VSGIKSWGEKMAGVRKICCKNKMEKVDQGKERWARID
jgi:hypothetical protein